MSTKRRRARDRSPRRFVVIALSPWGLGRFHFTKTNARTSDNGRAGILNDSSPAQCHDGQCDFFHSFQSLIVALAMSLTATRSHSPERLFRSAMIRCVALVV